MSRILLHCCCGPCTIYPLQRLRDEGNREIMAYWNNPNIHPCTENLRRYETLSEYLKSQNVRLIGDPQYDFRAWSREIVFREEIRCRLCYRMRFLAAASIARKGGFDAFTTTLLYSKFQKHELILQAAGDVSAETGIPFHYVDFREGWKDGVEQSRALNMYRQQYCGCIYSEQERYLGTLTGKKQ